MVIIAEGQSEPPEITVGEEDKVKRRGDDPSSSGNPHELYMTWQGSFGHFRRSDKSNNGEYQDKGGGELG